MARRNAVTLQAALLSLLLAGPALACLWDRDTLAAEVGGSRDVLHVIVGRFERNPALYYEMRLERVAKELQADPTRLDLYDDAAVAGDRLGRPGEAIAWMEKKAEQLARLPEDSPAWREHEYRYRANLGTFYAHRWGQNGGDRDDLADLQQARDLIAAAIELNPDAHFGRERYQLLAIETLLDPPAIDPDDRSFPDLIGLHALGLRPEIRNNNRLAAAGYGDAVDGLAGLVTLGAAWESVDVFHSLRTALAIEGKSSVAYLAQQRCQELARAGKGSALPGAPTGNALQALFAGLPTNSTGGANLRNTYVRLRAEADAWHEARTAYMLARLEAGRHPDTDPTFWAAYEEPPLPVLPGELAPEMWWQGALFLLALLLAAVAIYRIYRRRERRAAIDELLDG